MQTSDIHTIMNSFASIGLNEMDEVRLMNRVETKYVFSAGKLPYLLDELSVFYKVLEIDLSRESPYHTTYLDTSDLLFYTQHVRGKLNRHKIRYRQYESTGVSFLEIKKKTNKNRTIKWRIQSSSDINSPDKEASDFISKYLPHSLPELRPALINGFTRITLVGKESKERITLDYNLSFATPGGENSLFPFLAIAEIKRQRNSDRSPFGIVMKRNGIKPNSFSKYCIGSALVKEIPRKNTLKPNLLLINKIENEYIKSTCP